MAEYHIEEAGLNLIIETKYYNELDIEGFSHMMKDSLIKRRKLLIGVV